MLKILFAVLLLGNILLSIARIAYSSVISKNFEGTLQTVAFLSVLVRRNAHITPYSALRRSSYLFVYDGTSCAMSRAFLFIYSALICVMYESFYIKTKYSPTVTKKITLLTPNILTVQWTVYV